MVTLELAVLILPCVFSGQRLHHVPVLCDLSFSVDAENVKSDLLAGTGEVVNGLQEHLVAILKSADVIDRSLYGSGAEVGDAADESISACSVGEIVLDVMSMVTTKTLKKQLPKSLKDLEVTERSRKGL